MLWIVATKLIAPTSEERPVRWIEEDPRVDAPARRVEVVRQRRVHRPAGLGRLEEDAAVERDAAEQRQPVRQRVQLRERHVARADHQRHEVVPEAGDQRDDEQEDHRRPVHRHQAVVGLRADERVVRLGELEAHDERLDAADDQEHERRDDVEDPDLLVIGRGQPGEPAPRRRLDAVEHDLGTRGALRLDSATGFHYSPSPSPRCSRWAARSSPACSMSARVCSAHCSNSSGVTARTCARMSACPDPHSSAHWPS